MKNKISIICILLVCVLFFSSCGENRIFEPAESTQPVSSTQSTTELTSYALSPDKFSFGNIQMGMNTDEVQIAIGQASTVMANEQKQKYYFTNGFKGIAGISKEIEKTVYFIFNAAIQLEEIQYVVTYDDGTTYEDMVKLFKSQFGKYVEITSEIGKKECIWIYKDVYVVVTKNDTKEIVVSYFEKTLFESEYKYEVDLYRKG